MNLRTVYGIRTVKESKGSRIEQNLRSDPVIERENIRAFHPVMGDLAHIAFQIRFAVSVHEEIHPHGADIPQKECRIGIVVQA